MRASRSCAGCYVSDCAQLRSVRAESVAPGPSSAFHSWSPSVRNVQSVGPTSCSSAGVGDTRKPPHAAGSGDDLKLRCALAYAFWCVPFDRLFSEVFTVPSVQLEMSELAQFLFFSDGALASGERPWEASARHRHPRRPFTFSWCSYSPVVWLRPRGASPSVSSLPLVTRS